ncbi:MAG: tautomerase family protein, partial [Thermoanaerobaculia bacterium]
GRRRATTISGMPLVTITLRKGRPPEFLRKVGDSIHAALVAQAKIPEADRFQIFHEVGPHAIDVDPTFAGSSPVNRSEDVLIIQIILNTGRTDDVKSALYADIAKRLHSEAGVRVDDIFVNLVEVAKQNWSMASGLMTYP